MSPEAPRRFTSASAGHATPEIGALAVPGGGLVLATVAAPVEVGKDDEAIAIVGPEELLVFVELLAELAIEAYRDRDVLVVHQADVLGERLGRLTELEAAMDVDVDRRELRPRRSMLRQHQHRPRLKLIKRQALYLLLGL